MIKKCTVDIVCGFLDSGKTTFINSLLKVRTNKQEMIVIQCEKGKEKVDEEEFNKFNITLKELLTNEDLTEERILRIVKFYNPSRIIIESNGINDVTKIIDLLNSKELKPHIKLGGVITMVDATTLKIFLKNLATIMLPNIQSSDLLIINKCSKISKETLDEHIDILGKLNLHANIMTCYNSEDLFWELTKSRLINRG